MPLHNACSYGHYEVAELLVRHGASVNVADLWKFTPLHEAAAKGKYEICKLLLKVLSSLLLLAQALTSSLGILVDSSDVSFSRRLTAWSC